MKSRHLIAIGLLLPFCARSHAGRPTTRSNPPRGGLQLVRRQPRLQRQRRPASTPIDFDQNGGSEAEADRGRR